MRNMKKKISWSLAALLIVMNLGNATVFAKEDAEYQETDEIVYTQDVVTDFDADIEYEEQADGTYEAMTDDTAAEDLESGNILILPATEETPERVMEVKKVTETGDGYRIEGEEPDSIFDVVESVNTEGTAQVTAEDVVTADGVTVADVQMNSRSTSWKEWFAFTSTGATTMNGLIFHIDKQIGTDGSLKGDIAVNPSLEYKIVFDLSGVQEMTAALDTQLKISDFTVSAQNAGSIPVAILPYTFADGMFTAYVTISLAYSAEGEIYLDYEVDGICGVNYDGQDTSLICSYEPDVFDYGIAANGTIGAQFKVDLTAYGTYQVMNAELNAGMAALTQKEQGKTGYGEVYFYLDGSYGYGSILEPYGICGEKVIYGEENSPLKCEIMF